MSNANTGGPAFPTKSFDTERQAWVREEGMTLRDYFAAKAMAGVFMRDRNRRLIGDIDECAALAYQWADAMLKAREQ